VYPILHHANRGVRFLAVIALVVGVPVRIDGDVDCTFD